MKKITITYRFLFFVCLMAVASHGQLRAQDTTATDSVKEDRMNWLGLPIVFYTPETRFAFGGAVLNVFRFPKEPMDSRPSQIQLSGAYTLNKQILIYMPYRLYWNNEDWVAYGELGFFKYNYFFYGVGNYPEPAEREIYDILFPRVRISLMRQVAKGTYLGVRYAMDDFNITGVEPNGLLDQGTITGSEGGLISGLGPVMNYDSRDNLFWPTKGAFVEALAYFNYGYFGSDFDYSRFSVDASYYKLLPWAEHIAAFNFYTDIGIGDPPFFQMAMLGGAKKMRGYYEGQYRDRSLMLLQSEYRAKIYKRFSAVAFLSYGLVGPSPAEWDVQNSRLAGGGGLRYMLDKKEKINVRLDYGYGRYGGGFYFTVGEAF